MTIFAELGVPLARKRTYYLLDATSTWDSTTEYVLVVPAGKRWRVLIAMIKNDASQTSAIYWEDSTDVVIAQLGNQGANTGRTMYGDLGVAHLLNSELIMDAGEKLHFIAGGAQGAGAYIYVHVLEIDV